MTSYKPIPRDLAWAKFMNGAIREGGTMAYPSTQLIYEVSHAKKSWTLKNPEMLANPASKETHERTVVVLKEIGYACQ